MKKVLIIGEGSYIGNSFAAFAKERYEIKIVSSLNDAWRSAGFAEYDSILCAAGIAHIKQTKKNESLYYKINCGLAADFARKAKAENAGQFIFLSSMAVYGTSRSEIGEDTAPEPSPGDFYGGSKLKAEQELQKLAGDNFKLCIVRPPMVYGKGCKGNFPKLVKLAKITPVFPDYPNKRSMIYIDNLCNFLCGLIDGGNDGIFLPQNNEHINTADLVRCIAECCNKRIYMTRLFNPLIRFGIRRVPLLGKLFGDLYYTGTENKHEVTGFKESIKQSIE
jgi:UDP-glucose 4-epimerase